MSDLFEDTPTKELSWLLRQIHEREVALPEFQRDFVWEPSATQELIVSIASNYPAGSLLAIRNTHNYFAAREVEGAPPLGGRKPTYLVLDGQQRLTSLYQAFFGRGEYRYFMHVRKLIDGGDIDDEGVLFHVRANAQRGAQAQVLRRYADVDGQAADLVMPLAVLFGDPDGFLGWRDAMTQRVEDRDAQRALGHQLLEVRKRVIAAVERYKFPVVLLSDQTPPDAVCTIFETLNRTGVKLSVFDLLAARFWAEGVRLRDLWDAAGASHPVIHEFGIDPYYLLQIVALLPVGGTPSCKRKDVLGLTAAHVGAVWERAVGGLAAALAILRDDCGVMVPKWLPYSTIVIPFGALLARYPATKGLVAGEARRKLVRWFWCSVFSQSYENAPNSQSARDLAEVGAWLEGGDPPGVVSGFGFEPSALYDVTPRQRALYRGVIALILSRHPRDFHAAKPMTRALLGDGNVDDHHVFPDAHLRDSGVAENRLRDCVLNRTLIDRATNQSLSRRDPKDYFREMRTRLGEGTCDQILDSHLLPGGEASPLLDSDYTVFLEWRCRRIGQLIREATGAA